MKQQMWISHLLPCKIRLGNSSFSNSESAHLTCITGCSSTAFRMRIEEKLLDMFTDFCTISPLQLTPSLQTCITPFPLPPAKSKEVESTSSAVLLKPQFLCNYQLHKNLCLCYRNCCIIISTQFLKETSYPNSSSTTAQPAMGKTQHQKELFLFFFFFSWISDVLWGIEVSSHLSTSLEHLERLLLNQILI